MAEALLCKICGKRRAKRACPAVAGDICPLCCGTEREVSLSCPFECEYLEEAHKREKPLPLLDNEIAAPEVLVSEELLRREEELLLFTVYSLLEATLRTSGAVDSDAMEALAASIQTHQTRESGLIYETRPQNTLAAEIQRLLSTSLAGYAREREEQDSLHPLRNSDLLATLVFLYRIGQQHQNGRPRGRMFLDLLRHMTPPEDHGSKEAAPSIIL